jgi:hypothetical protein
MQQHDLGTCIDGVPCVQLQVGATASAAQERTIEWKEETSPGIASASSTD